MSIVPGRDVPEVPQLWVDAVNRAINDANHEDLCGCAGWPDACRYCRPGQWDIGVDLDIAVGVLEPLIRERLAADRWEHERADLNYAVTSVLFDDFQEHCCNEYGSVVTAGYRVEFSTWPHLARVEHVLPEDDLSDPNRLTTDRKYEIRLEMRDAYAKALAAEGWSVELKTVGVNRPILLAGRPKECA